MNNRQQPRTEFSKEDRRYLEARLRALQKILAEAREVRVELSNFLEFILALNDGLVDCSDAGFRQFAHTLIQQDTELQRQHESEIRALTERSRQTEESSQTRIFDLNQTLAGLQKDLASFSEGESGLLERLKGVEQANKRLKEEKQEQETMVTEAGSQLQKLQDHVSELELELASQRQEHEEECAILQAFQMLLQKATTVADTLQLVEPPKPKRIWNLFRKSG